MSVRSFFGKKHKYNKQSDLEGMTAEQILSLNPKDVSSHIDKETGGIPLSGVKQRALFNLLAYKKVSKELGPDPELRLKQIDSFLKRENLKPDPDVTKIMLETDNEIMSDQLTQKQLENRFRKLKYQKEIPYTNDEELYLRFQKLKLGGKRKRSTRKKRCKTKRKRYGCKKYTNKKK
jgi:hypothetical protein